MRNNVAMFQMPIYIVRSNKCTNQSYQQIIPRLLFAQLVMRPIVHPVCAKKHYDTAFFKDIYGIARGSGRIDDVIFSRLRKSSYVGGTFQIHFLFFQKSAIP